VGRLGSGEDQAGAQPAGKWEVGWSAESLALSLAPE
jgi:hypothetical protein